MTTDAAIFVDLLPAIIDLGPPEVILLVIADPPPADKIGLAITLIIENRSAKACHYVGIYLDSGDVLAIISESSPPASDSGTVRQ